MDTTVAEIMRTKFVSFKKSDPLAKAINVFLTNPDMVFPVIENCRAIGEIRQHDLLKLVIPLKYVDDGRVLGPAGIRDLLEHSAKTVGDIMKTSAIKVKASVKVVDAARMMLETDALTLEVVDDCNNPVGFVSELDVLKYAKRKLEGRPK